jgi:PAS domain S-box-containing protein
MNILIVDDQPTNLKLLRALLEVEGITVCEAADGLEALGVLKHAGVDAIISDILMPRMDGYRLCMEVRANPQSRDVPFIAYTSTYTSAGDEKLMIEMGADRFLRKPASAAVLTATVQEVVHAKRRRPPSPGRTRPETDVLNDYNQRLVAKLAKKDVNLAAKTARLRQAEDDMRTTVAQWQTFVALSANAVLVVQDDKLALANSAAARLLGAASDADLIGRRLTDFMYEDDGVALAARASLGLESPESPRPLLEKKIRRIDGSIAEIEIHSMRFQFHGRPALLVEARDVTGPKHAESRLALQHAVTASLSEINPKVLATLGCGLQWDFGELWTIERGAQVLRCIETWHPPSSAFQPFAAETRSLTFASGQGLPGRVWASGRTGWYADVSQETTCPRRHRASAMGLPGWIGFPIKLREEVVGVVGFFSRKMTRPDAALLALFDTIGLQMGQFIERKQLADQFRQAQKMEAIGTLAGGIAHDFNNILSAIYGYCELARMEAIGNASLTGYLDAVMGGARRATDLVRQILTFGCHQEQERRPIQLRHVTAETMRLLRAAVPATIEFQTALADDAPVVLADATQIHQILMNLGTNAAHAMREHGGQLIVKLENWHVGPKLAAAQSELGVGRYARLTVTDTGHGMDAETLARIYEPFFTTKPPGEGTGLGLAVVRGIVKAYEGAITVSSRCGEGTTFHVYFPAHLLDAEDVATASPKLPRGAGERILFVDDEAPLADIGKRVLDRIGYVTTTCSNARQALDLVSADPDAYALVITDQMMPGMMGTDLAQRLNAIRRDLPILLTVGYPATLQPDRLLAMGIRQWLVKPLSVQALADAVHQVLSRTSVPKG